MIDLSVLTPQQRNVLCRIASIEGAVTTLGLFNLLYGHLRYPPTENVLKVHICGIRRKLGRHVILTSGGNGSTPGLYYCATETKQQIKEWQDAQNDAFRNRSRLGAEAPGE